VNGLSLRAQFAPDELALVQPGSPPFERTAGGLTDARRGRWLWLKRENHEEHQEHEEGKRGSPRRERAKARKEEGLQDRLLDMKIRRRGPERLRPIAESAIDPVADFGVAGGEEKGGRDVNE